MKKSVEKSFLTETSRRSPSHNTTGILVDEKYPFKLLHRIARVDIIIGMTLDCFFILFAFATHWRDYTCWSILFCTALAVLAIFNNALLMGFNRTEISKEFSIFSMFWLIYRAVFLIAILIMTSIIFGAWSFAIVREAQFSVETGDLFSFFGYAFLAVLLGCIAAAVSYIPGGFRARLEHIQYRNYVDLDLDSGTVNVELSGRNFPQEQLRK
jgi:uncharacterized membrane protein